VTANVVMYSDFHVKEIITMDCRKENAELMSKRKHGDYLPMAMVILCGRSQVRASVVAP